MEQEPGLDPDRPLLSVPLASLKAEVGRLEKHLLDMPPDGFQTLHEQVELNLVAARRELQARRPEGAMLDQAIARQRQAQKAKTMAETHLQETREALSRADVALQQATEADTLATQEIQRVRALILMLAGLYGFLHSAGLSYEQIAQAGTILGAVVPPAPPPPASNIQGLCRCSIRHNSLRLDHFRILLLNF